jgi:hypothetical protein
MRIHLALIVTGALLASCATPYQQMGLMGGVNVQPIDATTLRITGRGNAFTSTATLENYVVLRAAEETQRRGYDLFLVTGGEEESKPGVVTVAGRTYTYQTLDAYDNPVTQTYSAPDTAVHYTKPQTNMVIRMLKGPEPADAPKNLFVAADVIRFLGPKVRR